MKKRNDTLKWTPIQEGRFHLRNMEREGESLAAYCKRMNIDPNHVHARVTLAQSERDATTKGPR